MTAADVLLEWVSEVGTGKWGSWRVVCQDLGLEPTGAARAFSDLGHVEFDWVNDEFAAVPPTAVLLPRSSGSVLITGARPRHFRERLEALACDGPFDVYCHPEVAQPGGPATWLCEGALDDFEPFCERLGITFQVQSGRHLAALVPVATMANAALRERPSERLPREWFDPGRRQFTTRAPDAQDGWWRVPEARRHAFFVRQGDEWFRVPVREYAPYLAYPQEVFLHYSAQDMVLEVDSGTALPPLLARAVTLQSGRLPQWDRRLRYVNVDQELVALVASRLTASVEAKP